MRGWVIGISAPSRSMKAPLEMDVTLIGARSARPANSRRRSKFPLCPGSVFVESPRSRRQEARHPRADGGVEQHGLPVEDHVAQPPQRRHDAGGAATGLRHGVRIGGLGPHDGDADRGEPVHVSAPIGAWGRHLPLTPCAIVVLE